MLDHVIVQVSLYKAIFREKKLDQIHIDQIVQIGYALYLCEMIYLNINQVVDWVYVRNLFTLGPVSLASPKQLEVLKFKTKPL